MKAIATILLSSLLVPLAMAQDEVSTEALEEEEEIRRYTVEVIIFSYEEDVSVGTEMFPPDPPPEEPTVGELLELLEEEATMEELVADEVSAEEDEEARELEFVLLTEEEFTLGDVAHQFALLDVYETVMHFGWTQATYPEEETQPIELRVFGEPPDGLDGSLTLYLSRYLHLVVDLAMQAQIEPRARRSYFGDIAEPAEQPVFYRIQEDRIFKNGDIRYFDHPRFGVVAKITRVEEEEPEEETEEGDLLLSFIAE